MLPRIACFPSSPRAIEGGEDPFVLLTLAAIGSASGQWKRLVAAAVCTSPDVIVVRGVCDVGWCDGRTLEFLVFFVPT